MHLILVYANTLVAPSANNNCRSTMLVGVRDTRTSMSAMVLNKGFHEEAEVVRRLLSVVEDAAAFRKEGKMEFRTALHLYSNPTTLCPHLQT
jgi:hypothetical protein